MSPLIEPLGWALLAFLWQGAAVACGLALALRLLARATPQLRYALACAALLLCLGLPLSRVLSRTDGSHAPSTQAPPPSLQVLEAPAPPPAPSWREDLEQRLEARLPLVVFLWAGGSLLLALRMGLGVAWVGGLRRRSFAAEPAWQARLDALAACLGLRGVRLRLSRDAGPLAFGLLRPVVLLPAALLSTLPAELVEALLAHELAHIRRHDYLINLLQSCIEVILFYHPAVWWISARIRSEREMIADDLAARALGEPRRLALALAELDRVQPHVPHLAPAAHGGILMHRIRRLLQTTPRPRTWRAALPAFALALIAIAAAGSALRARSSAPPPAPPTVPPPPAPPAPPAPPELPDAAEAPEAPRLAAGVDAYAWVQAGKPSYAFAGPQKDRATVERLRRETPGDFLWIRQGTRTRVLTSAAELAEVRQAFAELSRIGSRMGELGGRMGQHGAELGRLGAQMSRRVNTPERKELREFGRRMGELGSRMGQLRRRHDAPGSQLSETELKQVEAQLAQLEREMEPLQKHMEDLEARLEVQRQPMKELERQMEEAGKPMEALGQQMEALGRDMEAAQKAAEESVARAARK